MAERFAVIVPYRDREHNLAQLMLHLQWYLDPEAFDLIVAEQCDARPFNRGYMLNVGFHLARCRGRYSHYVFHDVDLLPLSADYSHSPYPVHLCGQTSQYLYEPPYEDAFGGVVLFTAADFETANGFSNHYWGWGREDYDLRCRCRRVGLAVHRRPGRFLSLPHEPAPGLEAAWRRNHERFQILQTRDHRSDGLSSLDFEVADAKEVTQLPFVEHSKPLARPVLWWSVRLNGEDLLQGAA